jgi:hypothetical protein
MIFNHLIEHEYSYIQTYQIHNDKHKISIPMHFGITGSTPMNSIYI